MSQPNVVELQAEPRETGAAGSKKLRSGHRVPAVLYGPDVKENLHFSVKELDLERLLKSRNLQFIRVKLNGETFDCIIKETEFHPLTDRPIHIDFYKFAAEIPFTVSVPVRLTGKAAGTLVGGKVAQSLKDLKIRTTASRMPAEVFADVTPLNIGDTMKVKDVTWGDFEVLTQGQRLLVTITGTRA